MMPATPRPDVAMLVPSLAGGGAERCTVNLAAELLDQGLAVDIVANRATGPFRAHVPEQAHVVDLATDHVRATIPGLVGYLRRRRPDAVLSSLTHLNVAAILARAASRTRPRLVVWEHNTLSQVVARTTSWRERRYPRVAHHLYPWADAIVAVSAGVRDDLVRTARLSDPVHVLPNPVVTASLFEQASEPPERGWPDDGRPVLVAVGRLTHQKDVPTLLAALARVDPAVHLLVLGDGPDRAALERLATSLGVDGRVDFLGFVANPYAYIARATALVSSSRFEGMPTVLVEALALGRPVVATDCPSGPRELLANGRWGRLTEVGDVAELATGIEDVLAGRVAPAPEAAWHPYRTPDVARRFLGVLDVSPSGTSPAAVRGRKERP